MLTWLRKHMKTIMVVVAVLFAASMFYGIGYQGIKGDWGKGKASNVLAKVNGQEVDPLRYQEILNRVAQGASQGLGIQDMPFIENLALQQAVDFTLMLSEARRKVRVPGREVDAAIEGIMRQQNVPSKRELENALKRMGLSMGKFRDLIWGELMVQKLVTKLRDEVRVTPDDLREIRASHILISAEGDAKTVISRIKAGEDFASLAKQLSRDSLSGKKGGDLGYFTTGMMPTPFEKAAFSLKVGEVSGIVKTTLGFHIIKLVDSRLRKFPGAEKDPEQAALKQKQDNAFRQWYAEVQSKAKVEVISPAMKAHGMRFSGAIQQAAEEYKKAILQTPMNPYLHVFLGDTYNTMGQKAMAISEYESAVKLEGGNPELYLILGKAYTDAGQGSLAAEQFKKASLVAGDNKALHERLLKQFQAMNRSVEAARERAEISRITKKESFEQGIKSSPR